MLIEFDMMGEEEEVMTPCDNETAPEEVETMDGIDHLYMDDQLYLQSIFDL